MAESGGDELVYTVCFPFCGCGLGARGFLDASMKLVGRSARFRSLGGIDKDASACRNFEYLTESPAFCRDISEMTVADVIACFGRQAPDVVFMSPPCQGASGLLSDAKSKTEKYSSMNELAILWTQLMLDAWKDAPPRLVLLENVPRLKTRAAGMLRKVRKLLKDAGYVFHDGYHDCGELGGLAQHRRRYLLVARHEKRVPPLLYQPIKRRVRACGEVLGPMPMPEDPAAGPMHRLPRISWLNWVRLALIPAGGDWRDLPGVLADGEARREKFKRHRVEDWRAPTGTIGGSGSNSVGNVADPRPQAPFGNCQRVTDWNDPVGTVTHAPAPSSGGGAVADPRIAPTSMGAHWNKMRVEEWDQPAHTVIASDRIGSGAPSIADPRAGEWGDGRMGVLDFDQPAKTIRGESLPSNGPFAVADPRLEGELPFVRGRMGVLDFDEPAGTITGNGRPAAGKFSVADRRVAMNLGPGTHQNVYAIGEWDKPARTVTGATRPGQGAVSVGDPRPQWFNNVLRVVPWSEPTGTVTGQGRPTCGALNVADPRVKAAFDHGYAVLDFSEPSPTVAGKSMPGNGAYSVADPRLKCEPRAGAYGVLPWDEAAKTVTGAAQIDNGAFAIADPRTPGAAPVIVVRDVKKPPSATPVIIAADGTWHRPLTTLELAALQGFPLVWKSAPLKLDGSASSQWRLHIGNAVPAPAARAIAERILASLLQADFESFSLSGDASVWVQPQEDDEAIVVGMLG